MGTMGKQEKKLANSLRVWLRYELMGLIAYAKSDWPNAERHSAEANEEFKKLLELDIPEG